MCCICASAKYRIPKVHMAFTLAIDVSQICPVCIHNIPTCQVVQACCLMADSTACFVCVTVCLKKELCCLFGTCVCKADTVSKYMSNCKGKSQGSGQLQRTARFLEGDPLRDVLFVDHEAIGDRGPTIHRQSRRTILYMALFST